MSKIQWTDKTFNPIRLIRDDGSHGGHWCRKISEGCANCYAEEQNQSNYFSFASHLKYTGKMPENLILDEQVLSDIIKLKKPHKIFMCSMTDIFGDWIPEHWIDQIFATMLIAKQHTFQVLTKRPERMREYLSKPYFVNIARYIDQHFNNKFAHDNYELPADNIWLGTTCENQKTANERIPHLVQTPAKVRFLSCEPLLEEIDLDLDGLIDIEDEEGSCLAQPKDAINWLIVGGESGKNARPCHIEWIRSLVNQCKTANIPVFAKQLGSKPINSVPYGSTFVHFPLKLKNKKGGDIEEFPEDLQVREFPFGKEVKP